MAVTHTLGLTWNNGGTPISSTISRSADGEVTYSGTVANGQTAFLVAMVIDVSQMATLLIKSDQAITIKTNSSGSPAQTLSIPANEPVIWASGLGLTNLLTTDVTALYFANASGSTANVEIRAAVDLTV